MKAHASSTIYFGAAFYNGLQHETSRSKDFNAWAIAQYYEQALAKFPNTDDIDVFIYQSPDDISKALIEITKRPLSLESLKAGDTRKPNLFADKYHGDTKVAKKEVVNAFQQVTVDKNDLWQIPINGENTIFLHLKQLICSLNNNELLWD